MRSYKHARACLAFAFLAFALGGCGQPVPVAVPGPAVGGDGKVVVHDGASGSDIAALLDAAGVVAARDFANLAETDERALRVQPGSYTLPVGISASEALDRLLAPGSKTGVRIVVRSGDRASGIADQVATATGWPAETVRAAFRVAPDGTSSLDGTLGIATYDVLPGATATSLAADMLDSGHDVLDYAGTLSGNGRSVRELLTIASLLEAEALPGDWGKASRVVSNRLSAGMPLQLDSTAAYASGVRQLELTAAQMENESPFNTYTHPGLPPGPIGQVSRESVLAAATPEQGAWLYWVTVDPSSGLTRFAIDYPEFLKFKDELRTWLAAQEETPGS